MAQLNVGKVHDFIKPIVDNLGYEIVEVEYKKKQNGMNLTVFIDFKQDSNKSITLDDCETVHNAINDLLDELNPTNDQAYILNVSSPGLDRPIKTQEDLQRNIGKMIEISLYSKINNKKLFVGKLINFDNDTITLEGEKSTLTIERKSISNIIKHITF